MHPLFDTYIIVDWSAASKPTRGENSIWIGCLERDEKGAVSFCATNPATRRAAEIELFERVNQARANQKRVLLGFDFAMGYPTGTADAMDLGPVDMPAWQRLHRHITEHAEDSDTNANNRFRIAAELNARISNAAHPFWGVPAQQANAYLKPNKGDFSAPHSLPEHRLSEAWIRQNFKGTPKSVWQLAYIGSVGSQALLGIPTVSKLRSAFGHTKLWPFETGLRTLDRNALADVSCIIAEVYPSIIDPVPMPNEVKDAAQTRALAHHFAHADANGLLGKAFLGDYSLTTRKRVQLEQEEGWILAI
ncbi:MAG: hypothetical protein AAGJ84_12100 [Pseudomonadota bacterium]